jgi:3',5'-cyclic AMP phosphodiesterase CpdA
MSYQIKRIILVLCLVAALFSAALLPAAGYAETLRFVFLADSRGATGEPVINTLALNPIIGQIKALDPPPAFVVFGGDMAYRGCIDGTYQFQTFKDLFADLTKAGIPLYTAIGNHELYVKGQDGFFLANQQQYQLVFSENPTNGPTSAYDHLVYSFESPQGDCFFAALDPYFLTADAPSFDNGTIDPPQLAWLEAQVAQTKATHKFLFIHVPYYFVNTDPEEGTGIHDATWSQMWNILDSNSFDLFCCGHSHLYSRKTIDSSIAPNPPLYPLQWRNNVIQLLCGTCGAPPSTGTPFVNPILWHISQAPNTYYFSVVDINGSLVTVNSQSYNTVTGVFSVMDTFAIKPISSLLDMLLLN